MKLRVGMAVEFDQGDAGTTLRTGVISRVWSKPKYDPYITIKTDDSYRTETYVRVGSTVRVIS